MNTFLTKLRERPCRRFTGLQNAIPISKSLNPLRHPGLRIRDGVRRAGIKLPGIWTDVLTYT